jgi:uncharacterized protein YjbI with pentapeptide repeats
VVLPLSSSQRRRRQSERRHASGLSHTAVIGLVILTIALTVALTLFAQALAERGAIGNSPVSEGLTAARRVDKLNAEIQKIRSETAGSLFWLKMIGLFVTVGSAVGGYLIAHTRSVNMRLQFDKRNEVIRLYQAIVEELSSDKPVLRAAAAVRLGAVLEKYPSTWEVEGENSEDTRRELINLTKQVLASALTIESEPAVLKALTISVARHRVSAEGGREFDMTDLDLSGAKVADAYWADCNLSRTDLYNANLENASLRRATLAYTQFRDASLASAVLAEADCANANFKRADLREVDLKDLKNWAEINVDGMKYTNIHGVRNAPVGFKDWARSHGAVEMESDDEWRALLDGRDSGQTSVIRSLVSAWRVLRG